MNKDMFSAFIVVLFLSLSSLAAYKSTPQKSSSANCNGQDVPVLIQKIDNWAIVAENETTIFSGQAFSGKHLTFSIVAKPKNKKNKISINKETGKIGIIAEEKDNFDVKVTASNACGSASTTFNIQIDAEE